MMPAVYRYSGPLNRDVSFSVNEDTMIWLGRMIIGEGGRRCSMEKARLMMWAMANRYILHPGKRHWPAFVYMLRRFSQPINPRWQRGGDLAAKYAGRPEASEERLKRRERICELLRNDFGLGITVVINDFSQGKCPVPAAASKVARNRLSNWASYNGVRAKYPWGIDVDGDWFFEDKRLCTGTVIVE